MRRLRRVLLAAGLLSLLLVAAAQAAPIGALKQYRVPTANSGPRAITNGADGNRWFVAGNFNSLDAASNVGRITPAGDITEFHLDCFGCSLSDIVQGPGDALYFTSNEAFLDRITTSGQFLERIPMPETDVLAGDLAVHGTDIWIDDFNNDSVWRYDTVGGQFEQFPLPLQPADVAVDADGIVWFTTADAHQIGRLDPATRAVTFTATTLSPNQLTIATDGDIWFTSRFPPQGVGELDPQSNTVREFPLTSGPQGIAASPDGSVWFTQETQGNIARIDDSGAITEGKVVKGSNPFGITVDPDGNPWYTMINANKIGQFQLR